MDVLENVQSLYDEGFIIDNDSKADWAIETISEEVAEYDRLLALANEKLEDLKNRIDDLKNRKENCCGVLKAKLYEYFQTVPHKTTKTQETYKLLSGTLTLKKPTKKIVHDDEKLLEYLKANDGGEFIKVKYSVDWTEFKKELKIVDDNVVDTGLGLIVDCCSVEESEAEFVIK